MSMAIRGFGGIRRFLAVFGGEWRGVWARAGNRGRALATKRHMERKSGDADQGEWAHEALEEDEGLAEVTGVP